jgi:hypothetical protein
MTVDSRAPRRLYARSRDGAHRAGGNLSSSLRLASEPAFVGGKVLLRIPAFAGFMEAFFDKWELKEKRGRRGSAVASAITRYRRRHV